MIHLGLALSVVVLELFTSEGCSSCPPADDLLTAIAQRPAANVTVIPLAFHVTYWDSDAWRDRFSDTRYTDRQKEYQSRFRIPAIYTPQSVIDGQFQTSGNDARGVDALLKQAATQKKTVNVDLATTGDAVTITANGGEASDKVLLAITEDGLSTEVRGGENRSRTLHHTGVVRSLQPLGTLGSGFSRSVRVKIRKDWQRDKLHAVVLVQDRDDHVVGAATTPF